MKKLLILLTLGIVAMVTFPVVSLADDEQPVGEARLHNIADPTSGITAVINFLDDGTNLYIGGTATGMVPFDNYVSLIYDNGSVPFGVEGPPGMDPPHPCEPTIFDGGEDDITATMLVGSWAVDTNGTGSLNEVNISTFGPDPMRVYVPLDKFRTISIRRALEPNPLQACGLVVAHEIDDDDDSSDEDSSDDDDDDE